MDGHKQREQGHPAVDNRCEISLSNPELKTPYPVSCLADVLKEDAEVSDEDPSEQPCATEKSLSDVHDPSSAKGSVSQT